MTLKVLYLINYKKKQNHLHILLLFHFFHFLYPKLELSIHMEKGRNLMGFGVIGIPDD